MPTACARNNCASPISAPAAARCCWRFSPNCPARSGSAPISAAARCVWRARTPQRLRIDRAHFVACDLAAALGGPFDLIVSNPPYVATGDIAGLAPEVRDFDPRTALDGGTDGLNFYRAIAATVPMLLRPGGILAVELGAGQARPVADLFAAAGLALLPARADLSGRPRALVAKKHREKRHERGTLDPGKKALGISAGTD